MSIIITIIIIIIIVVIITCMIILRLATFIYGFYYLFNNLRFNKTQDLKVFSAAHVVASFASSEILKCVDRKIFISLSLYIYIYVWLYSYIYIYIYIWVVEMIVRPPYDDRQPTSERGKRGQH